MTCALPALVLTISGRRFQIMPALIAAFCPERCGWPGCPRWSSLLTGRALSSRIHCRLDRVWPPRNGLLRMCPWRLGGEPSGAGPGTVHYSGPAFYGAGPDEGPPEQGGSSHGEDDVISVAASDTLFREAFWELGFALMTRELGRTLSTLVHARRQVWLAQSPLTEPCRRMLRALPVVLGELFGSAALEALERTAQASRTRQQLAGLHRPPRRPVAAGAAGGSFQGSFPPPVPFLGSTSMARRPARAQGDHGGDQGLRPVRSAHSGVSPGPPGARR
ncbi:hypothetical protein GOODEAATRI_005431 [Goodea atripinnis]|uniref:Uncharacterized protein n=1 Tax=Goodea atripinnis TaxID=208336 RepID=A0ABV0MPJ1_9TELE